MSDAWFYETGGRRVGPLAREELRALVAAGRVRPDAPAWPAGGTRRPAAAIDGQFPAAPPRAATAGPSDKWKRWAAVAGAAALLALGINARSRTGSGTADPAETDGPGAPASRSAPHPASAASTRPLPLDAGRKAPVVMRTNA